MASGVVYTGFDPAFQDPLNRLFALAKARGYTPNLISGTRAAYAWPGMKGQSQADLYSQLGKPGGPRAAAPPGYSPHQYGVAGDVTGIPQSLLEQLAPQVGLRAIHSDPNHIELANWQQEAAAQPPRMAWDQTNPANVPSQMALNMEAGGPPGTRINGSAPTPGALAETGPESSNASGGAAQPGGPMDNRQIIFNRLTGIGLKPYQALGAMWSFGGESGGGLNTGSYNSKDPGGAIGFGQWLGDRRAALEDLAKGNGTPWTDINTQSDHLINELTNKNYATYQPGVFDALMNAKTTEDAARITTGQFERPKVDNSDDRIKKGAAVGSLDDQGNFVPGTASAIASNGPASTGPRDTTAPDASASPSGRQTADNQSWFGRFTQGPIDPATGKPDPKAVTPMAQIADAIINNTKNTQAKVDAAGPVKTALSDQPAPMARNVSPMGGALLPNVGQTYGQTLNSFARPLTYNAAPPQAPQMPAAGFQGGFGPQGQGVSLNSLPALPMTYPGQIRPLTLDEYGYQGAGYAS